MSVAAGRFAQPSRDLRDEIDAAADAPGISTSDVERDYLYGRLLAGLLADSRSPRLARLKGSNAYGKGPLRQHQVLR